MNVSTDDFKKEIKEILKNRLHFNEEQAEEMFHTLMLERALELDKEAYGTKCYNEGVAEGIKKEHLKTLESVKNLLGLGSKIEDLKSIFHLNDEEVEFVTSV